jgi:hypothetical protein
MPTKWNIVDYRLYMSQVNVPINENKNYIYSITNIQTQYANSLTAPIIMSMDSNF